MSKIAKPNIPIGKSVKISVEDGKTYYWCSCGMSANQPFCDGSHKNTDFSPVKYIASKTGVIGFCGCKHSKDPVICDGSHKFLTSNRRTRIVFMGTPAFALPALRHLSSCVAIEIVAVYTKPPKPSGRGNVITKSDVHMLAEDLGLNVYTPSTLRMETELAQLKALAPDFIIVAAYGLILPQEVLDIPLYCCLNIHPSMLPKYRGAAPIQHTILNGERKTSVCIMRMDEGMDTGDIVSHKEYDIDEYMTAKMLHDEISQLGANELMNAMKLIISGNAEYITQESKGVEPTYAPKISRDAEKLNFATHARLVNCQIRAFSPRPGAYFIYENEQIKIIDAIIVEDAYEETNASIIPGQVLDDNLLIACAQGTGIRPTLLQRAGRKMIYTEAFLRGFPIKKDERL